MRHVGMQADCATRPTADQMIERIASGSRCPEQSQKRGFIDRHAVTRPGHRHTAPRHKQDGRHHRRTQAQSQQHSADNKRLRRQHAVLHGREHGMGWGGHGEGSGQPEPYCEHIERADRTFDPISCSNRDRCQRQWTMPHTLAQQAVERQRSGTVHDIPAKQCCPEQVLLLRCARELRPQGQHQHQQRNWPDQKPDGHEHRSDHLHNDHRPRRREIGSTNAGEHSRGKEGFCQGEANQKIDDWGRRSPGRSAEVQHPRELRPQPLVLGERFQFHAPSSFCRRIRMLRPVRGFVKHNDLFIGGIRNIELLQGGVPGPQ